MTEYNYDAAPDCTVGVAKCNETGKVYWIRGVVNLPDTFQVIELCPGKWVHWDVELDQGISRPGVPHYMKRALQDKTIQYYLRDSISANVTSANNLLWYLPGENGRDIGAIITMFLVEED